MCTMRAAVLGGHPQGTWSWQTWGRLQLQNCVRGQLLSVWRQSRGLGLSERGLPSPTKQKPRVRRGRSGGGCG